MNTTIIIPSRFASVRLPGKSVALIAGKPMVQWVYESCLKINNANDVIIATDHEIVEKVANGFGGKVIMTSAEHVSGTDRCAEVAQDLAADYIINVQGDEPFIDPDQISAMINYLYTNPEIEILTLFQKMDKSKEIQEHSTVKLVKSQNNKILYFSRLPIPFQRNTTNNAYYKHVGIYAFKKEVLMKVSKLKPTILEQTEGLEQLRWLENGFNIFGFEITGNSISIDTPDDLESARTYAEGLNK